MMVGSGSHETVVFSHPDLQFVLLHETIAFINSFLFLHLHHHGEDVEHALNGVDTLFSAFRVQLLLNPQQSHKQEMYPTHAYTHSHKYHINKQTNKQTKTNK